MKSSFFAIIFSAFLFIWSCKPTQVIEVPAVNPYHQTASYQIDTSPVFSKSFTGFVLYHPEKDTILDALLSDKYFTPASNTKLFTCYTALKIFGEKMPALRYYTNGDSLVFWGTGDPSLLNSDLDDDASVIDFLKNRKEKLYYAPQNVGQRFGNGWSWDDYNYGYMPERNDLPIYGNMTYWQFTKEKKKPVGQPDFFNQFLVEEVLAEYEPTISRTEHDNIFRYSNPKNAYSHKRVIPFKTSNKVTQQLLANAVQREIGLVPFSKTFNQKTNTKTVYGLSMDRVLQEMMQPSDNHVAEQLLLAAAYEKFDIFDIKKIMTYAKDKLMADAPDKLVWADGSGVSRYNLFTPRTMVYILDKMRDEFGEERLFKIFAAGGESGTIKRLYKSDTDTPYVYAKTGTLSNKHCLSGFVKTKSGKTLIFSFMHNNYISGSSPLKKEMTRVLEYIRDRY